MLPERLYFAAAYIMAGQFVGKTLRRGDNGLFTSLG
jgi:hypothetical protein